MCRKINKLQLHISFDFFWFLIKKRHFWWENKRRIAGFLKTCVYIYIYIYIYTHIQKPIYIYIYIYIYVYKYRESAGRFSRETVLNTLKQSGINILRGKRDATTFSRQACFVNRFTLQGFNERIFMWLSCIY